MPRKKVQTYGQQQLAMAVRSDRRKKKLEEFDRKKLIKLYEHHTRELARIKKLLGET